MNQQATEPEIDDQGDEITGVIDDVINTRDATYSNQDAVTTDGGQMVVRGSNSITDIRILRDENQGINVNPYIQFSGSSEVVNQSENQLQYLHSQDMQMIPEVSLSKESTMIAQKQKQTYPPQKNTVGGLQDLNVESKADENSSLLNYSQGVFGASIVAESQQEGPETARRDQIDSNAVDESVSIQGTQFELEHPAMAYQVSQDGAGMVTGSENDVRSVNFRTTAQQSLNILGSSYSATKGFALINDQNETVKKEINELIENFEKTFVSYFKLNTGNLTQQDISRLFQDELKQTVKRKLMNLGAGEMYQRCDPFKMEEIVNHSKDMQDTNNSIRQNLQRVGTAIKKLAQTSLMLQKDGKFDESLNHYLRDLGLSVTDLNQLFHDINFKVLQNDDKLGQIKVNCTSSLSSQGFLKKYQQLEQMYDTLQTQHSQIKQQLFLQTEEYQNLQSDFDISRKLAEENQTESFKLKNLEAIVEELRLKNTEQANQVSEQKRIIFEKDRELDKLQHQVQFGLAHGRLSTTFAHDYPGPGGSIQTGQLVSKVELADEAQVLLSQAQENQLKWRHHSENMMRATNRFLDSMKQFQKAVHQSKKSQNQVKFNTTKLEFESNRKDLQLCLDIVKKDIDNSNLDIIVNGGSLNKSKQIGEESLKKIQDQRTAENLNRVKNILDFQMSTKDPLQVSQTKLGHSSKSASKQKMPQLQKNSQNINQYDSFKENTSLNQSQNLLEGGSIQISKADVISDVITIQQQFRPQEVIRLEQLNEQLQNELKSTKEFHTELSDRVNHLKQCIQEGNQRIFLSEKECERLKKMNEQLLREKVETEFKLGQKIKELKKELGQTEPEEGVESMDADADSKVDGLKNSKKVQFEKNEQNFEENLLDVKGCIRETKMLIEASKRNTLHMSKPMSQISADNKKPIRDPFKTPDPMIVAQETCAERQDTLEEKKADLLREKEDVIMNLTIQKQKLKDIITEMEKQAVDYVDEITNLQKQVDKWQSNEVDHQELTKLREEYAFIRDRCTIQTSQIEVLNKQLYKNDVQFDQLMAERLQLQQQQYDNLQKQFTQERGEFIRQSKLAQDLQSELSIANDKLKGLHQEHTHLQMMKDDCDKELAQARDRVITLSLQESQFEFQQNKLKQFDLQIIENQNFISKLQNDLLNAQEQNKILIEKIRVVESLKEGEVGQKIKVYQDEIMHLTKQFQTEIGDLKKKLLAKQSELEYQKNSLSMKADKHSHELQEQKQQVLKSQASKDSLLMSEIQRLQKEKQDLQVQIAQQVQDSERDLKYQLDIADKKFKQMEDDYLLQLRRQNEQIQILEGKQIQNQQLQQLVPKDIGGNEPTDQKSSVNKSFNPVDSRNQDSQQLIKSADQYYSNLNQVQFSFDHQKRIDQLEQELQEKVNQLKATDLAFEQVVLSKNKLEKELYEVKKQLEEKNESVIRLQADKSEEQESIQELKEQLRIAQSQIYENNEAHLKQIKQLRERSDELQINQELDDLTIRQQALQKQLNKQEQELKDNEREIGSLRQFKRLYEGMKKDHFELEKQHNQLQSTNKLAVSELNKYQEQIDQQQNDNEKLIKQIEHLNETIQNKTQHLKQEVLNVSKCENEKRELEIQINMLQRKLESEQNEQNTFMKLQSERIQERKSAEQEKLNLQTKLMEIQAKLIANQKQIENKDTQLKELQDKIDAFEKEKEDAFWDEKNSMDSAVKSQNKSPGGALTPEHAEQLYEFQKQIERIYDEVQANQVKVQDQLNEFFNVCPKIDQLKDAYASGIFPIKSQNITSEFSEQFLQNNQIKLQRLFWLGHERYFVLQKELSLKDKIEKQGQNQNMPFLLAESTMDQNIKKYLHSFIPQTQTLSDDPRLLDLMEIYDKQTSEYLEQLSLIKIDYQVFMNKVLAQSDDIDDVEQLEKEHIQLESNRLQKSNIELREHNLQYQLANVELRKRLDEVNSILRELREQNQDPTSKPKDDVSSQNLNEQQISYGKNLSALLQSESPARSFNIPGQSVQSGNLSQRCSDESEDKNAAMEHIKMTLVMLLKRMPIIDKINEDMLPILYSLLNLQAFETQEIANARAKLAIYKIDEKATKKAQKDAEKKVLQVSSQDQMHISEASFGIDSLPSVESQKEKKKSGFLDKFRKKKEDETGALGTVEDTNLTGSFDKELITQNLSPPKEIMKKETKM